MTQNIEVSNLIPVLTRFRKTPAAQGDLAPAFGAVILALLGGDEVEVGPAKAHYVVVARIFAQKANTAQNHDLIHGVAYAMQSENVMEGGIPVLEECLAAYQRATNSPNARPRRDIQG